MLAERYSPRTVTTTMSYLNAIMRAAYASRRIGHDPTIGTRSQRRRADDSERVGPADVPTRDEVRLIWASAPPRYRAAIALGTAGLRIGEVLGLTAEQLDLGSRLIVIDRQLQRLDGELRSTTPKGEKNRRIGVPEVVAVELERHPRDLRAGGLLFCTPRTGHPLYRDELYKQGGDQRSRAPV
jgi:integrase